MKKYTQKHPKYEYKVVIANYDEIGFNDTESEFSGKAIDRFYDLEHGIEDLIEEIESSIGFGENIIEETLDTKEKEETIKINDILKTVLVKLEKIVGDKK